MGTYRIIPSIEQLLQRPAIRQLETAYGHTATVHALREETAATRARLSQGSFAPPDRETLSQAIETGLTSRLHDLWAPSLDTVINGTGVIVHTNLGRAPLAKTALTRLAAVAAYSNLEYDLDRGARGSRAVHAASLLQQLTGAESAVVVNNNAAALLLTLTALGAGREVIISRGELVEIGGGFRIPDVLRQSGATLREVGTTNRTRPADYAAAVTPRTGLILRVHPSNFTIEGFAERPALDAVVAIGRRFRVPVVEDLGSGNLRDAPLASGHVAEPTVHASVAGGVDICCFSGDKLLGGPQAGIIVGRRDLIDRLGAHPLMRAVRVGKLTYAALEATLLEHAAGRASTSVPVVAMIETPVATLERRALAVIDRLGAVSGVAVDVVDGHTAVGGGTTPGLTLPTRRLRVRLTGCSAADIDRLLRHATPPVIGRIDQGDLVIDLRTVQPDEDGQLANVLAGLSQMPARSE